MKPYYDRDGIIIYNGECSQVMEQLIKQGVLVDLTVTSPPYDNLRDYEGYVFPFRAIAGGLWQITTISGVVVWIVGDQTIDGSETGTSFSQALYFKALGFKLHDTMIWRKNGVSFPESNRYYPVFEYMFVLSKNQPKTTNLIKDKKNNWAGQVNSTGIERQPNGKIVKPSRNNNKRTTKKYSVRGNIWIYERGYMKATKDKNAYNHPAIFPEALAHDHIISWSNKGDLIFDPMMGSGTTLKMAQQLGRQAIGIDISEEYCKIAVDRLKQPSFFSIPLQDKPKPVQTSLIDD